MIAFGLVKEKDLEIIKNIAINAFEEDLKKYGSMPPGIETLDWHRDKIKDGYYYKIKKNNHIVGAMKIYDKGHGHFHLGSIFIETSYQNEGIGHKAMVFLDKTFNNAKKWTLDTPYENYRNHYFYEKHGFRKVKEIKPDPKNPFTLFYYKRFRRIERKEIN